MLFCHIPDRFEQLVRYVGWYPTRCRGERARSAAPQNVDQAPENTQALAVRARSSWARLIHKVYEVDTPQSERPPPRGGPESGAPGLASKVLTYHPVPDIA